MIKGSEALPFVAVILVFCWFTDLIDGPIARLDPHREVSWIGENDAVADLSMSLGIATYLTFSNLIPVWFGVGLVLILLLVWFLKSYQMAWPLYVIPYVIFWYWVFREAQPFGWLLVFYLIGVGILRWSRFKTELFPQFLEAVGSVFRGKK